MEPERPALKLLDIDDDDRALVRKAKLFLRRNTSEMSGVSAALRTTSGKEYFGLCIDAKTATVGVCAEFSAIGTMISAGEKKVGTVVAVTYKGKGKYLILPPCGKCRDFIRAFGNPFVILQVGEEPKKARLSELIPFPWDEGL